MLCESRDSCIAAAISNHATGEKRLIAMEAAAATAAAGVTVPL